MDNSEISLELQEREEECLVVVISVKGRILRVWVQADNWIVTRLVSGHCCPGRELSSLHPQSQLSRQYLPSIYTLSTHYLHSIYTVKYLYNIYTGGGHHPPSDGRARAEVSAGYLHNSYISKQYLHKI